MVFRDIYIGFGSHLHVDELVRLRCDPMLGRTQVVKPHIGTYKA